MHCLPLPALLVHVRPKVPERLAEEELMQWDLKRKGTWLAFLNDVIVDVIVFSFEEAFVHILVLFSRKGCKSPQKELNERKRREENWLQQQKHRNMLQFETPVRWVDGWKDWRRKETIYLWFCFLGIQIKHGVVVNKDLELLSVELGTSWESLALLLQFHRAEIDAFHYNNKKLRQKGFNMLMVWKRRGGSFATYQVLHDALCHPFVQRRDLVERFCIDAGPFSVST